MRKMRNAGKKKKKIREKSLEVGEVALDFLPVGHCQFDRSIVIGNVLSPKKGVLGRSTIRCQNGFWAVTT